METRILVVEDEPDIRELISLQLRRAGFSIEEVGTGEEAMARIASQNYQLLVLDWMLPGVSGLDIARKAREKKVTPPFILMVTARAQTEDVIQGLEAGADDYVTKPFEGSVLMARVKALLRRSEVSVGTSVRFGDLLIDIGTHEVYCSAQKINLTASEFKLLTSLAENKGKVLTRERLVELVQGEDVNVVGRTIDTHVFGLRKKLGSCGDFIETIRGVGYRIKPEG